MFPEMEKIISKLKNDARIIPEEVIFCNIITYYGRARLPHKAAQVFNEIPSFRCERTIKSVNTLLNALLMCREFGKMKELVAAIGEHAQPDACTYNIAINLWCMKGELGNAWKVFDEMPKKGIKPNVVTFGTLIHGLCSKLELDEALRLKTRMEIEFGIRPNSHIYAVLVKGLCKIGELDKAIVLKDEMLGKKELGSKPAVYSALISAFFKVGLKKEVPGLIDEMRKNGTKPDTVTYNTMIHGFCLDKDIVSAFRTLNKMEKDGCKPDVISYNVIVSALCREGRVKEANELLEDMPRRKCKPDVVTYRVVFDGLCDVKRFADAAVLLDEMIFVGYTRPCCSISKFVDGLSQRRKIDVLIFLVHLVKRNCVDRYVWRFIISLVYDDKNGDAGKLFNSLIQGRLSRT